MNEEKDFKFRDITIPGDVLDDSNLSDGAKIMYGKIARLSWKTGVCWASNAFLDGTLSGRNASRFIAELKKAGFIHVENEKSKQRKIRICSIQSKVNLANSGEVEAEKHDISTSPNMAMSNIQPRQIRRSNIANSGDVNLANSGDRTSLNLTNLNNTTAASPPEQESETPEKSENTAAAVLSPEKLKILILEIDNRLIFDFNIYERAASYMTTYELTDRFIIWLRDFCENKDYRDFKALFYSLFFKDSIREEYFLHLQRSKTKNQENEPLFIYCPVCGNASGIEYENCPVCDLPRNSSWLYIKLYIDLYKFPTEKRKEYLHRRDIITYECGSDYIKNANLIADLNKEFGIGLNP